MAITRKHYGIDGDVQNFVAVTSMERIGGGFNEDAENEYYDAEGDKDDYYDGEYSNAGGLMGKMFGSGYEKRRNAREKRKLLREKSKGEERKTKAGAKLETAKSKTAQAQATEKSVAGDIAMADALKSSAPTTTPEEEKKGMSMGLKIGIGVGVVVVLGVVGFIIYKSMKGKKAGK
ncbi:MAG: hypothetical protein WCI04_00120 [archaeon]